MNIYQKVELIFNQSATFTAKGNKVAKLAIETSDPNFGFLLDNLSKAYLYHLHSGQSRNLPMSKRETLPFYVTCTHQESVAVLERCMSEVKSYIASVQSSSKPEWQVLAEKYHWVDPKLLKEPIALLHQAINTGDCQNNVIQALNLLMKATQ